MASENTEVSVFRVPPRQPMSAGANNSQAEATPAYLFPTHRSSLRLRSGTHPHSTTGQIQRDTGLN